MSTHTTDSSRRRARVRTKRIKVHAVSIDVDETATHWLVFVSPGIWAQSQGISYHRSRLRKCVCTPAEFRYRVMETARGTCKVCGDWTANGMAKLTVRLLRSYPKQTVGIQVPVAVRPRVTAQGLRQDVARNAGAVA